MQPRHEHGRVHDRHVQLGVEQVMINRHQIVDLGLSTERDEIVVVWIAYLDPLGRGHVRTKLAASTKRSDVRTRPALR